MGFHNPPLTWKQLEQTLSGTLPRPHEQEETSEARDALRPSPPSPERPEDVVPYAELHAHSTFSFLDGASSPEALVQESLRLGHEALALVDHDGFYGAVRFAEAAEGTGLATVFGAELSEGLRAPQTGVPDPEGSHLLLLARGEEGYRRLSRVMTSAQLRGAQKGRPVYDEAELAENAGEWIALTGCRKGSVRRALMRHGRTPDLDAARREIERLSALFGRDNVVVELTDHLGPLDTVANDALFALARELSLPVVATNNVHYATKTEARLARTVAAIRARRSMEELDPWLPRAGTQRLRSGAFMQRRFARYPGAVAQSTALAREISFPLRSMRPALPRQKVPEGHTPISWLRHLVWQAVPRKYPRLDDEGRERIERELSVIEQKDFPGYFLIVHSIVQEAKRRGILCQGRGSAANSAVCYLLGITAVDAIFYRLPFERFLSAMRDEEPDIDVDFDSNRREEIIQWVFDEYGRTRAAQVANVIQYRPKNAVRDVARALGFSPGQQDAWSARVGGWGAEIEVETDEGPPPEVLDLAGRLLKAPRHLGIHSGGMVLTERPVSEVVPIEHARMPRRTVIQWDKDDAAWMGLVKFDLLGLGILAALQHCFDLVAEATGERFTLDSLPKEEAAVYDMLCRADAIGVFQVESRAQMGLLPRLQPRTFYDLAIQIALIRPGPIQGGAVHPFVRRKMKQEEVSYDHPLLVPVLERTLGVPVFQEQLMHMAMAIGDCSAEDADLLRRAMGSKRGEEKIERLRDQLYQGMFRHGLSPEKADAIYARIQAFAHFGFAESHSLSFALLVYASAWLKLHYPGAFLASLLRAQPMGFYSPATLVQDARRHGVEVRKPDVQFSGVDASLERLSSDTPSHPTGLDSCTRKPSTAPPPFDPGAPDRSSEHRRDAGFAVRLGLAAIRGIGEETAERIVRERAAHGRFQDMADLARRADLDESQMEALATADACASFGLSRRAALWQAASAAQDRPRFLPGTAPVASFVQPPLFGEMTGYEELAADLWTTGVTTKEHPFAHFREELTERGVLCSRDLRTHESGRRVSVAGLVTHRQRPATASGITFLNLEDEAGLVNIVCSAGVWRRHQNILRTQSALVARGILERSHEGVINIVADGFIALNVSVTHASRDFR